MKTLLIRSAVVVALFASMGVSAPVEPVSAVAPTGIAVPSTSTTIGVLGN